MVKNGDAAGQMRWAFHGLLLWKWVVMCCECCSKCEEYAMLLGLSASSSYGDTSGIPYLFEKDAEQPAYVPRRLFKVKSLWEGGTASVAICGSYNQAVVLDRCTGKKHMKLNGDGKVEFSFLQAVTGDGSSFRIRFILASELRTYTFGYIAALGSEEEAEVVSWLVMPGNTGLIAGTWLRNGKRGQIYHFTEAMDKLMPSQTKHVDPSSGSSSTKPKKVKKEIVNIPVAFLQPCHCSAALSHPPYQPQQLQQQEERHKPLPSLSSTVDMLNHPHYQGTLVLHPTFIYARTLPIPAVVTPHTDVSSIRPELVHPKTSPQQDPQP